MKQALIIGGTTGMGWALAQRLLNRGDYRVIVTGRSEQRLQALKASQKNDALSTQVLQLTDEQSIANAIEVLPKIDHLVLAGSSEAAWGPLTDTNLNAILRAFEIKALGYLRVIQAALPKLAENASITLLGGAAGRKAMPGTVGLSAVNGALQSVTRTLAAELAPRRVNLVSPGLTDTQAYADMPEEQRRGMFAGAAASLPVGRVGQADDIAGTIEGLMNNGFISGAIIDVDGGASL